MPGIRIPADVELEDRLAFGLTGRQLGLLGAGALGAYGVGALLAGIAPLPLALAGALLTALLAALAALARRDGLRGEQLALAAGRHLLGPRLLLLAPEGLPGRLPGPRERRAGALSPPVRRILACGLVQLADGSHCALLQASGTSFGLREQGEQAAFVAAFARFLNGLAAPAQILVTREPASLERHARELEATARGTAGPLAAAAVEHAHYLRSLAGSGGLTRRRILVVLRSPQRDSGLAQGTLERAAAQAAELLLGAGVGLTRLDGAEAAALLAGALAAPGPAADSRLEGVTSLRASRR